MPTPKMLPTSCLLSEKTHTGKEPHIHLRVRGQVAHGPEYDRGPLTEGHWSIVCQTIMAATPTDPLLTSHH